MTQRSLVGTIAMPRPLAHDQGKMPLRHLTSTLLIVPALMVTGLSTGCSDAEMREAGRGIQQELGQRWETWRQKMDAEVKAQARLNAGSKAPAHAQGTSPAVDGAEA